MAEGRTPSVNQPVNAGVPPPQAANNRTNTIAGSLPDLARLTLDEREDVTGSFLSGRAVPAPDETLPATPHVHVTIHAHQGSSVIINAAPSGAYGAHGRQVGGRIIFPNPGHRALAATPAPTPPAPIGGAVVPPAVPTPPPGIDVAPAPANVAAAVPAPTVAVALNIPDDGNVGSGNDPNEDIYPEDPSYTDKWFAVIVGRRVGIFPGWLVCGPYVTNISGNLHKSFKTRTEAYAYYLNKKIDGEVYVVPQ